MGMKPILLLLFTIVSQTVSFKFAREQANVVAVAVPSSQNSVTPPPSTHTIEWIKGPDGYLYQFHLGDQSWLSAREFCKSQNSDLISIRNEEQLDWVLSHYQPTHAAFAERWIEVGYHLAEGETEWKWYNPQNENQTNLEWTSGEPFDHSSAGRERCGLLRIREKKLDDVDCEIRPSVDMRFICERTEKIHVEQQKSANYIWQKIESLFSFFGIGGTNNSTKTDKDYIDEVKTADDLSKIAATRKNEIVDEIKEEKEVKEELEKLSKISLKSGENVEEGSGQNISPPLTKKDLLSADLRSPARARGTPLKEISESEGSGVELEQSNIENIKDDKKLLEIDDPERLSKLIENMEKMIDKLEKETTVENEKKSDGKNDEKTKEKKNKKEEKKEGDKVAKTEEKKEDTKEVKKEKKETDKKKEAAKAPAKTGDLEEDFDKEINKKMPSTDITPPPTEEEDCEEGSGEKKTDEDEDEQHETLKIPKEREAHIKEFLTVLRTFLGRAGHDDLRKLLDKNSNSSLLEKMKIAIKETNDKEFARLEQLEQMKKEGEDVSKMSLSADLMSDKEREILYNKISGVVIQEAEKESLLEISNGSSLELLETATQPATRTTTEETRKHQVLADIIREDKEEKKEEKKKETEQEREIAKKDLLKKLFSPQKKTEWNDEDLMDTKKKTEINVIKKKVQKGEEETVKTTTEIVEVGTKKTEEETTVRPNPKREERLKKKQKQEEKQKKKKEQRQKAKKEKEEKQRVRKEKKEKREKNEKKTNEAKLQRETKEDTKKEEKKDVKEDEEKEKKVETTTQKVKEVKTIPKKTNFPELEGLDDDGKDKGEEGKKHEEVEETTTIETEVGTKAMDKKGMDVTKPLPESLRETTTVNPKDPLNLFATVKPLQPLPPLPSLEKVLENLGQQFKALFAPKKL